MMLFNGPLSHCKRFDWRGQRRVARLMATSWWVAWLRQPRTPVHPVAFRGCLTHVRHADRDKLHPGSGRTAKVDQVC